MKFWTPKIRVEEKSWSVVLNPLRSELDKKRVAEKISELFRLSFEEARELVQSTPLILLDELPHPSALQLQGIFQEIRADVTLTNDSLVKRRCYRAVWPEPPNLSFLEVNPAETAPEKEFQDHETPVETTVQTYPASMADEATEGRYRELELLYEERTREVQELKQTLEKELKDRSERNSEELRATVQDWEERYHNLKEEYQETKAIYEEKILQREKEQEALKKKVGELESLQEKSAALKKLNEEKALHLEKQNKGALERLSHLESSKGALEQSLKEQSEAVNLWREKYQSLAQKSERFEALYEEERKRREQAEESRRQISELAERTRQDIQAQMAETERWRKKFQELEENQKGLEEEISQFTTQQNAEVRRLRESNQELEMQLESAQRQARDLLLRVEQQDMIEKRTRLANDLSLKESRLRELALENERLRQEIQDRELRAQSLGSEQAGLEREVLEIKQAQRHLLEQSKMKEKTTKLKRPHRGLDATELRPENG